MLRPQRGEGERSQQNKKKKKAPQIILTVLIFSTPLCMAQSALATTSSFGTLAGQVQQSASQQKASLRPVGNYPVQNRQTKFASSTPIFEADISALENRLSQYKSTLATLSQKSPKDSALKTQLDSAIASVKSNIATLEDKIATAKADLKAYNLAQDTLTTALSKYNQAQQNTTDVKARVTTTQAELDQKNRDLTTATQIADASLTSLNLVKQQLQTAKDELLSADASLTTQIEITNDALISLNNAKALTSQAHSDLLTAQQALQTASTQLTSTTTAKQTAQSNLSTATTNLATAKSDLTSAQQAKTLTALLAGTKTTAYQQALANVQNLTQEVADAQSQYDQQLNAYQTAATLLSVAQDAYATAQGDAFQAQANYDTTSYYLNSKNNLLPTLQENIATTTTQAQIDWGDFYTQNSALGTAQSNLQQAQQAYDSAHAKTSIDIATYNQAIDQYTLAYNNYVAKQSAYQTSQQTYNTAQSNLNTAQSNYDTNLIPDPNSQAQPAQAGLTARVYNNLPTSNPLRSDTAYNLCLTRTLNNIEANWGGGNILGCGTDRVMIHYTGYLTPTESITYLMNQADDGFYMDVNGTNVINNWYLKGCAGNWNSTSLQAGQSYAIDAWFFEWGGGACSTLYYQSNTNWGVVPASWYSQTQPTPMIHDPALLPALQQAQGEYDSALASYTTASQEWNDAQAWQQSAGQLTTDLYYQIIADAEIENSTYLALQDAQSIYYQTLTTRNQAYEQACASENAKTSAQQLLDTTTADQSRLSAQLEVDSQVLTQANQVLEVVTTSLDLATQDASSKNATLQQAGIDLSIASDALNSDTQVQTTQQELQEANAQDSQAQADVDSAVEAEQSAQLTFDTRGVELNNAISNYDIALSNKVEGEADAASSQTNYSEAQVTESSKDTKYVKAVSQQTSAEQTKADAQVVVDTTITQQTTAQSDFDSKTQVVATTQSLRDEVSQTLTAEQTNLQGALDSESVALATKSEAEDRVSTTEQTASASTNSAINIADQVSFLEVNTIIDTPAPQEEGSKEIPAELSAENLMSVDLTAVDPTELTEAQAEQLVEAALETFETAEVGSPEYEQALDALYLAAEQDDIELSAELAAIPGLAGAVELLNLFGNAGADMSPAKREESKKIVVTAVVAAGVAVQAAAGAATSAAASSSSAGSSSGSTRRKQ